MILHRLLREELGFDGAIVSDSLLMDGAKLGAADEGDLAVKTLAAGVDILLDVADPLAAVDVLEAAVATGRLSEERVNDAFARVRHLKSITLIDQSFSHDVEDNRRHTEALALDVARRATVVLKNNGSLLPLDPRRSLGAIFVNPYRHPAGAEHPPLAELLQANFSRLTFLEVGADPSPAQLAQAAEAVRASEQLLLAFIVKPAAWHRFGLPRAAIDWLQQLAARCSSVAACLGAPQGLESVPAAAAQIYTRSDVPASQQALVEILLARQQ